MSSVVKFKLEGGKEDVIVNPLLVCFARAVDDERVRLHFDTGEQLVVAATLEQVHLNLNDHLRH